MDSEGWIGDVGGAGASAFVRRGRRARRPTPGYSEK